jgi:hypothetical protein
MQENTGPQRRFDLDQFRSLAHATRGHVTTRSRLVGSQMIEPTIR